MLSQQGNVIANCIYSCSLRQKSKWRNMLLWHAKWPTLEISRIYHYGNGRTFALFQMQGLLYCLLCTYQTMCAGAEIKIINRNIVVQRDMHRRIYVNIYQISGVFVQYIYIYIYMMRRNVRRGKIRRKGVVQWTLRETLHDWSNIWGSFYKHGLLLTQAVDNHKLVKQFHPTLYWVCD